MYTLFLMPRRKPMLTGPNGERRPTFRVAATVSALEEMVAKYEDPPDDREPATHPAPRGMVRVSVFTLVAFVVAASAPGRILPNAAGTVQRGEAPSLGAETPAAVSQPRPERFTDAEYIREVARRSLQRGSGSDFAAECAPALFAAPVWTDRHWADRDRCGAWNGGILHALTQWRLMRRPGGLYDSADLSSTARIFASRCGLLNPDECMAYSDGFSQGLAALEHSESLR